MSNYKLLVYVALVVFVMQIAVSEAAPKKGGAGKVAPAQCKAPTGDASPKPPAGSPIRGAKKPAASAARASRGKSPSGRRAARKS